MTREETKKCIEVMQAYVDGKEIVGGGSRVDNPAWNWAGNPGRYKVKKDPFEEWWGGLPGFPNMSETCESYATIGNGYSVNKNQARIIWNAAVGSVAGEVKTQVKTQVKTNEA